METTKLVWTVQIDDFSISALLWNVNLSLYFRHSDLDPIILLVVVKYFSDLLLACIMDYKFFVFELNCSVKSRHLLTRNGNTLNLIVLVQKTRHLGMKKLNFFFFRNTGLESHFLRSSLVQFGLLWLFFNQSLINFTNSLLF